ncbi:MAG: DNA-protecting protein DprA [Elusimicrobia bacterium]|nr:DNA-protecting protein DprA [Elusimicrobiota bacterium]
MKFPTDEREARLLFNLTEPLGPVRFSRLVDRFGSAAAALRAGAKAWGEVEGFAEKAGDFFGALEKAVPALEKEKKEAFRSGARVVCASDPEYPDSFRRLRDAPPVLYLWGELKPVDSLSIALVGSRRPSTYGTAVAQRLARELAQAGVTVVSGLARGVDGAAHAAALSAGGRTVGILGSGLSRFYPAEHRTLARRMAEHGAVVTEFPLTSEPDASHFPRRNRLIAALALGVVVIEALERSGALITAGLATDQGKEVFAVPGSIFSPLSRGPHRLIKDGAKPVESALDVLEDFEVFREMMNRPRVAPVSSSVRQAVSGPGEKLLAALSLTPVGMDGLARRAGLTAPEAAKELLALELAGLVRSVPGKQYVCSELVMTKTS